MNNELSITVSTATVYSVRNGGEFANITIKHGTKVEYKDPRNWVNVTIDSSFGAMSHFWPHIGSQPWYEFLHDPMEQSYFMEKLVGMESLKQWSFDKSLRAVKRNIIDARQAGSITRYEARLCWDELRWLDSNGGPELFVNELGRLRHFQDEPWEFLIYEKKGWIQNFWDTLWVPFTTKLSTDEELRNAA